MKHSTDEVNQLKISFTTLTHLQVVHPVFDFCLHARVFLKDIGAEAANVISEGKTIAILRIWQ